MKIADYYDLEILKSNSEQLVLDRIGKLLDQRDDICKCEQCVLDLIAYVLNNVSPDYGTSLLGSFDPNQEREKGIKGQIEIALKDGLRKVTQHPNHST